MLRGISFAVKGQLENMSGWNPSRPPRPPWDTQEQPTLSAEGTWYGAAQGPRVIIKPQGPAARGGRGPGFSEPPRRSAGKVVAIGTGIGLVTAALIVGAVELTHLGGKSDPSSALPAASQGATAPAATPTAPASPTSTATSTSTAPAGGSASTTSYKLSDPATAGGYSQVTPVAATVQAIGSGGATQLMTAVQASGGKTTSTVSSEYLIAGNQVLGYAGYNGTYSPAAVIGDFKAGATGVTSQSAGPHGGQLACGQVSVTAPAASTGEVCVWATTSTVGMVEFYGGNGTALEAVAPAKAAADTLKFRDDAEAAK